jgi:hypothetical protein
VGLTLRRFSEDPAYREQLHALRDDIKRKWLLEGLHIAQVVELGLPLELLNAATRGGMSHEDVSQLITDFLLSARKFAVFVQEDANVASLARDVSVRLASEPDSVVVLFSMGRSAGAKLRGTLKDLRKGGDYKIALSGEHPRLMAIIIRSDSRALSPRL